ncbi:Transport protein SGAT [Spiroplasma clarkii]|uniref:Ascorbate-specific PTS system EIIC component n=1 Tax=Spiroplasma clarkii TaxID=2139 RepID=A0A1Y0L2F7_9MOLU|nr:PTS ascorbate transporter subunit IIC [Spiroplasma clarkii]ARU91898.1 Transport protein SGAT [Spiroplasma clarkii]ATX71245.1 PTS system, ascorbate-specific IIC component [Spiroplasma clarkii]
MANTEKKRNDLDHPEAGVKNRLKKQTPKWVKITIWVSLLVILLTFIIVCLAIKRGDILNTVFYQVLVNNVLAVPSILIGIIVLLGYLLQGKAWFDAVAGMFKGICGYLILQIGSSFLTGVSRPLMVLFGKLMGTNVVLLDTYTSWSEINEALGTAVSIISYTVLIGLAFNILLVALKKITNVRSINVTGHIMFQQSSVVVAIMYFFVFKDIANESTKQLLIILASGILIGLYWGVFSNLAYAPTQKVSNNAGFTIGHQQMLGVWAAYHAGRMFALKGKEVKSAEKLNLKKGFRIFHDNIFTSAILLLVFFGVLFITVRIQGSWPELLTGIGGYNLFGDKHWILQLFGLVFIVVAALQVLMFGARMFVAELQKSFIGISGKLIPGASVGIDIAGSFSYGEKAVTFGFLAGAIGNFLGIGLVVLLGQVANINVFRVIIMVGFIPMFFDGAALGLYANASGGWKACLTIPFIAGFIIVFGAVLVVQTGGSTGQIFQIGYNGLFDWTTMWAIILAILSSVPSAVGMGLLFVVALFFILIAQMTTTEPGKSMPIKRLLLKKWIKKDEELATELAAAKQAKAEAKLNKQNKS